MFTASQEFGFRIMELRKKKKITQQELADELGITRQSLGLYERGERAANVDLLRKAARFFEVTTDYLVGLSDVEAEDMGIADITDFVGINPMNIASLIQSTAYNITRNDPEIDIINLLLRYFYEMGIFDIMKLADNANTKADNTVLEDFQLFYEKLLNYYSYDLAKEFKTLTNETLVDKGGVLLDPYQAVDFYKQKLVSEFEKFIEYMLYYFKMVRSGKRGNIKSPKNYFKNIKSPKNYFKKELKGNGEHPKKNG